MIDFMVLAAPRSATAWCSVWLTTGYTMCYHDPLWDWPHSELDQLHHPTLRVGIACTAVGNFPEWVNRHPAKKVILYRPPGEVNLSLQRLGLPPCPPELFDNLDRIEGMHVPWTEVFEKPARIFTYLLGIPFDAERHQQLKALKITTDFTQRALRRNPAAQQQFIRG